MGFRNYFLVEKITPEEAKSVFGITEVPPADELKKLYFKLAQENHPDKGGSTDKMQQINAAYELLKSYTGSSSVYGKESPEQFRARYEKEKADYLQTGKDMLDGMLKNFNPQTFIDYFNKITGLDFEYELLRKSPTDKDYYPHYAGFSVEFRTKDHNTKFLFEISASITSAKYNHRKTLSGGSEYDISYDLVVTTEVFHNNKRHKLTRSNYKFTNDHSIYKDPTVLFPESRVNKIVSGATSKREFKPRDMRAFLKHKLNAEDNGEWVYIPLSNDYKLVLNRNVFMKIANWSPNGLYKGRGRVDMLGKYKSFPETEQFAVGLDKIVTGAKNINDQSQLIKYLDDELTKLKEEIDAQKI